MNKEVNEKKKRYAIVITFLVLMICITGGTYAYFALTASNNSVTGSVGGASLNLTVTKVYPTSEHNNKNMIPQLESTLDEAISTEHKCIDGNGNVICQVYKATVTNVGSTSSVLNGTISFTGIDSMPNLKWMRINDSNTLGTYSSFNASTDKALFESEKSFGANTSNTYYFVFWIDEIGEVQTDSGTFRANIEFDSSTGGLTSTVRPSDSSITYPIKATDLISTLYNDGSSINTVHIGGDESKPTVSLNNVQKIMMVDQGNTYGIEYRYYGNENTEEDPDGFIAEDIFSTNNYISFNNELWRIISSSKVFSSESDTTGSQRLRIIKDTPIGKYPWDSDDVYSNNWADATLMCQLNTMYYNDTVPACIGKSLVNLNTSLNAEARNLIDNTLWYLGGGNTSYLYADDYYSMERNNSGYGSNPTRWIGKVGLMYTSDYKYAADLSTCTGMYCDNTDWLYSNKTQWLVSPGSSVSNVWYQDEAGGLDVLTYRVNFENYVRPLVVLKPNVVITGGSGTDGEPYQLALSE